MVARGKAGTGLEPAPAGRKVAWRDVEAALCAASWTRGQWLVFMLCNLVMMAILAFAASLAG